MDEQESSSSRSAAAWAGVDLSAMSPRWAQALRRLMAVTDELATPDVAATDRPGGREALAIADVLAIAASRLTGAKVGLLPVIEADGMWAVDGARSSPMWLSRRHGMGTHAARVQAAMGRTLRDDLPVTAQAVQAGRITVEDAQILAQLGPTTEQRRAALADPANETNEAFLVERAATIGPDNLRKVMRTWAACTDPDADDRGYVEACDMEHLEISRVMDMYDIRGLLTVPHGQQLKAALAALMPARATGDTRTPSQRRAEGLANVAKVALDCEASNPTRTARPRINVLVEYETLVAILTSAAEQPTQSELDTGGAGIGCPVRSPSFATRAMLTGDAVNMGPRYEDGTSITRTELDIAACTSTLARHIFGPRSEVLDVGRAERLFTGPRRAALIARDKHCRYPGCTAPPIICDCHHIDEWVRDNGRTAVHRGILLCTFHHDLVHRKKIRIELHGNRFRFTDRHGQEITAATERFMPYLD